MRILLLEDGADLAEIVALGLRNESYAVDIAGTCAEAEDLLRTTDFDVACFDLGLPDGNGLDLVRRLAVDPELRRPRRVLVLTRATPSPIGSPGSMPVPTTISSSRSNSPNWSPACGPSDAAAMTPGRR